MMEYTVKQIAEQLNTNQETVRRWIRSGKLKAVQHSKKGGNIISENEFKNFLKMNPKYAKAGASMGAAAIAAAVPLLSPLYLGYLTWDLFRSKNRKIAPSDIEEHILKQIRISEDNIKKNADLIERLQTDIAEEQAKIAEMHNLLKEDLLKKMANEVNAKHNK